MATNTTAADGRGIAIDNNSMPTGTDLAYVHHNYFKARNNRAFRCRSRHCLFRDNIIEAMVSDKDGYGTIHWADQQQNYCSPSQSYGLSGGIPNAEYNIWTNPASGRAHYLMAGQDVVVANEFLWGGSGGVMAYATSASFVNKSITAITCSAGTATATATGHGMAQSATNTYGYIITIAGCDVSDYNGQWTLATIPDANSFTFAATCSGSATTATFTTVANTTMTIRSLPTLSNPNFTANVGGTSNTTITNGCSGTGSTSGAGAGTASNPAGGC
jgi:hypothetical protein